MIRTTKFQVDTCMMPKIYFCSWCLGPSVTIIYARLDHWLSTDQQLLDCKINLFYDLFNISRRWRSEINKHSYLPKYEYATLSTLFSPLLLLHNLHIANDFVPGTNNNALFLYLIIRGLNGNRQLTTLHPDSFLGILYLRVL